MSIRVYIVCLSRINIIITSGGVDDISVFEMYSVIYFCFFIYGTEVVLIVKYNFIIFIKTYVPFALCIYYYYDMNLRT